MGGTCARQTCSTVAVVRIDFDGLARVVWIDDLAEDRPPAALSLCRRHADSLRPPRRWEVRDLRPAVGVTADSLATPGEPKRSEPAADPSVSVVAAGSGVIDLDPPAPVPTPAWSPHLFAQVDAGPVLDARSPLLSRAFRGH